MKYIKSIYIRPLLVMTLVLFQVSACSGFRSARHSPGGAVADGTLGGGVYRDFQTRAFTLANGMDVLLVSNPKVPQSAAAMTVAVGQWHDPEEHIGLSHFLEHMLFQGSEKYPGVDEYDTFIRQKHQGETNAYTAYGHTNYHFAVNNAGFDGAVDRFAQFFIAPLFEPDSLDKERHNVHDEAMRNRTDESWRQERVKRLAMAGNHPGRHLSIGTLESLKNANREVLIEHYKRYYSADKMKLVLVSNQPLAKMEALARGTFSAVPRHETVNMVFPPPYTEMPLKISRKAFGDKKELNLLFNLPYDTRLADAKALDVVGYLLTVENPGSLAHHLKHANLITELETENWTEAGRTEFWVSMKLTEAGQARMDEITEAFFAYVNALKREGVRPHIIDFVARMKEFEFNFKPVAKPYDMASKLAVQMNYYPALAAHARSTLMTDKWPAQALKALELLSPRNLVISYLSPAARAELKDNMYDIEYKIEKLSAAASARLLNPGTAGSFHGPAANPYAPTDLALAPRRTDKPVLALNQPGIELWFHQDDLMKSPRASLVLRLRNGLARNSLKESARLQLWVKLLNEGLIDWRTQLSTAGLQLSFTANRADLDVTLTGISQHFLSVLDELPRRIRAVRFEPARFENIKTGLVEDLRNHSKDQGWKQAFMWFRSLGTPGSFSHAELAPAIAALSATEIADFQKRYLGRLAVKGLVYGNVKQDAASAAVLNMVKSFGAELADYEALGPQFNAFPAGAPIALQRQSDTNMNSWVTGVQLGPIGPRNRALASLLATLWETPFYTEMRTNRKLGYVVALVVDGRGYAEVSSLLFVIEGSGHSPNEFAKIANGWIQEQAESLKGLPENTFLEAKQGLIESLKAPLNSMDEMFERLRSQLFIAGGFDHHAVLVKTLETISRDDFVQAAQAALAAGTTRRASAYVYASDQPWTAPEGQTMVESEPGKIRESLPVFGKTE